MLRELAAKLLRLRFVDSLRDVLHKSQTAVDLNHVQCCPSSSAACL